MYCDKTGAKSKWVEKLNKCGDVVETVYILECIVPGFPYVRLCPNLMTQINEGKRYMKELKQLRSLSLKIQEVTEKKGKQ